MYPEITSKHLLKKTPNSNLFPLTYTIFLLLNTSLRLLHPMKSLDLYLAPVHYNQSTLTVICVLT